MPKVSIVVPVYNVEKYLGKCLESIINQTLKDIEIICIDDGSTDSSAKILDEYQKKDKRIKVVHKKNSGYGNSMNIGTDMASGEYIGIVESDDYILPEMYEKLYETAKNNNLDLVKSDYYFFWEKLNYKRLNHFENLKDYYNRVLDKGYREIFFEFLISNWTGIYKKDFLINNNIRYNETPGASYQDTGFWVQVMSLCEKTMWIDQAFYMYRQDNPSASVKSSAKMMALKCEYDFAEDILLKKRLSEELKICNYYRMTGCIDTFLRIDDLLKYDYTDIIKKEYYKYKDSIKLVGNLSYSDNINKIQAICENPDSICKSLIRDKAKVIKLLESAESIIIYGTGERAKNICLKLYNLGYYDKIDFAVVSEKQDISKFMNLEVKNIGEISARENNLILIAVKKNTNAYSEIESKLKEYGFSNYSDTEMFLNI